MVQLAKSSLHQGCTCCVPEFALCLHICASCLQPRLLQLYFINTLVCYVASLRQFRFYTVVASRVSEEVYLNDEASL